MEADQRDSRLVRRLRLAALVAAGIAALLYLAEEIAAAAEADRPRPAPRPGPRRR